MRKTRFTEEQIFAIVRESETPGQTLVEVAKKHGTTDTTLFAGGGSSVGWSRASVMLPRREPVPRETCDRTPLLVEHRQLDIGLRREREANRRILREWWLVRYVRLVLTLWRRNNNQLLEAGYSSVAEKTCQLPVKCLKRRRPRPNLDDLPPES